MDIRMLYILFIELIVFIVVLLGLLFVINSTEAESKAGCTETTGAMRSFDVSHGTDGLYYKSMKTTKRYDDKFFGYLEHIQEQRDKTFMKGRVFLIEK